jgi:hypothetical protein
MWPRIALGKENNVPEKLHEGLLLTNKRGTRLATFVTLPIKASPLLTLDEYLDRERYGGHTFLLQSNRRQWGRFIDRDELE